MDISVPKGKYVLAVSGGVDSMALLHLLVQKEKQEARISQSGFRAPRPLGHMLEVVVGHFNHGIRPEAMQDEKLVTETASRYGMPVEVGCGELGIGASEETARKARYEFLNSLKRKHKAKSIITAHHQDDLIETAFINLIRGTGRQGLTSIRNPKILRPLLNTSKKEILKYAKKHKLDWHEDTSNSNTDYLRNYIRLNLIPKMTMEKRLETIKNLDKVAKLNEAINIDIANLSRTMEIDRQLFTSLPSALSNELLVYWLRRNNLREFDRKGIQRLSLAIKTARAGTRHEVITGKSLYLTSDKAVLN